MKSEQFQSAIPVDIERLSEGIFDPRFAAFLREAQRVDLRDVKTYRRVAAEYLDDDAIRVEKAKVEPPKKGFARFCNVKAEQVRMRQAMAFARFTGDWSRVREVENIVETNLRTLTEEFVLGGTSRFGYKVLRHPDTGESKLVFYDALEHAGESFKTAWLREDVRISYLRAIQVMPESLELRDWIYLRSANDMFDRWSALLDSNSDQKQGRVDVLISAPPKRTDEAKKIGYGTRTLLYEYKAQAVDCSCVEVRAVTHIGEFTRDHYRRMAQDVVHPEDAHYARIKGMRFNPSDIDLMSVVFSTTFSANTLEELEQRVEETEEILYKKSQFMRFTHPFAWWRQVELVETRLKDTEFVERFHAGLAERRREFIALLQKMQVSEQELWSELRQFEREATDWYKKLMIEKDKKAGKIKSEADERRAGERYGQAVEGRSEGSVCQVMGAESAQMATASEQEALMKKIKEREGKKVRCPALRGGCGREFVYKAEMGSCCPHGDCGWDFCYPDTTGLVNRLRAKKLAEMELSEPVHIPQLSDQKENEMVTYLKMRAEMHKARRREQAQAFPEERIRQLFQVDSESNSYIIYVLGVPLRYSPRYVHSILASKRL